MSYQALYRRYRPKKFEEVYGQEQNTYVLKKQISQKVFGHAYLFTGTRGTGKTSTAKIFSRAVNCLNEVDGEPCNQCENCLGIMDERIFDVIEMDAASNNSVDDVRELKEKAKYLPTHTPYKVYIIDEVHMLSKEAFNALLKTLEEPPAHLIFILATTEPHKLPATILSRCQRFDFRRITIGDIANCLSKACEDMGILAEKEALEQIAILAEGAMRDAYSILERCISGQKELRYGDVVSVLGLAEEEIFQNYAMSLSKKDIQSVIEWIGEEYKKGSDFGNLTLGLIRFFRILLLSKVGAETEEMDFWTSEKKKKIKALSGEFQEEGLKEIIIVLSECLQQMKYAKSERLLLECTSIKLMRETRKNQIRQEEINEEQEKNKNQEVKKESSLEFSKEKKVPLSAERKEFSLSKEKEKDFRGSGEIDMPRLMIGWDEYLESVKQQNVSLYALLREGEPEQVDGESVYVRYGEGFGFHKQAIDRPEKKELLERLFEQSFQVKRQFLFFLGQKEESGKKEESLEELVRTKFHGAEIEIE